MKIDHDSQHVIRWAVPGWTGIIFFALFSLLDNPHYLREWLIPLLSVHPGCSSVLVPAALAIGGIPLGYIIYQLYFCIRWMSPVAQGCLDPVLFSGRKEELKASTKGISDLVLARGSPWRLESLQRENDHRHQWSYLRLLFAEATQSLSQDVIDRHRRKSGDLHALGAITTSLYLAMLAFLAMRPNRQLHHYEVVLILTAIVAWCAARETRPSRAEFTGKKAASKPGAENSCSFPACQAAFFLLPFLAPFLRLLSTYFAPADWCLEGGVLLLYVMAIAFGVLLLVLYVRELAPAKRKQTPSADRDKTPWSFHICLLATLLLLLGHALCEPARGFRPILSIGLLFAAYFVALSSKLKPHSNWLLLGVFILFAGAAIVSIIEHGHRSAWSGDFFRGGLGFYGAVVVFECINLAFLHNKAWAQLEVEDIENYALKSLLLNGLDFEHPYIDVRNAIEEALRREMPKEAGLQYKRPTSLLGRPFSDPSKGEIWAWSQIWGQAQKEAVVIVNTHPTDPRGAKIVVDYPLHPKGTPKKFSSWTKGAPRGDEYHVQHDDDCLASIEVSNVPPLEVRVYVDWQPAPGE